MTTSELRESHARLLAVLKDYLEAAPPFVGGNVGAPGSAARVRQQLHIDVAARAWAAVAAAERVGEEQDAWSIVP